MRKTNLQVCEHNKSTDSLNQRHKFFQPCSIDTSQQHQQHWYAQLHRWKRDRYLFEARVLQCDDECFLCHQRRSCSFCHSSAFIRVRSKQVHILHKRFYLLRNSPVIPCVQRTKLPRLSWEVSGRVALKKLLLRERKKKVLRTSDYTQNPRRKLHNTVSEVSQFLSQARKKVSLDFLSLFPSTYFASTREKVVFWDIGRRDLL